MKDLVHCQPEHSKIRRNSRYTRQHPDVETSIRTERAFVLVLVRFIFKSLDSEEKATKDQVKKVSKKSNAHL